jgi:hypothetical protein
LDLDLRRVYRFGYLGNGCETLHESQADAYPLIRDRVRSFVVVTDPAFRPYRFDHLAERSRRPAVNQDSQADRAA